jgi:hypothetical protein
MRLGSMSLATMLLVAACGDDGSAPAARCVTQSGASACIEAIGHSVRVRGTGWAPTSAMTITVGDRPSLELAVSSRGEFVGVVGERTVSGAQSGGGAVIITGRNDPGETVVITMAIDPAPS